MDKRHLITLTLILSVLAFSPLVAQEEHHYTITQVKSASVSEDVASILHEKGLEEDAAKSIARDLVSEDDTRFTLMAENLLISCPTLQRDELMTYLSQEALHRQKVELHSYGQLVGMFTKIRQETPQRDVLQRLSHIAKLNEQIKNS